PLDLATLVPLLRASAFGRGYVDLEIALAVLALLVALGRLRVALLAAAVVLLIPGLSGHAAQTSPRGVAVALDWVHLAAGAIWLGGLTGLLVLWRTAPQELGRVVP